ncbi:DUF4225 domain-containing protein [Vibrio alginolyticus]|uniref:DUF4225 domain-containing protein n=6 Tax=Vibrio harveyi group TaxID=717610 RepID=UPI00215D49EE|nr:DUF4225 domain-containing protein [Vibrio alginolyticus]MCR9586347.1 DUF4225 domain-containing protein [Vibrio alginolyticus]MCR9899207.1 DUF4225 domain-containing protein [Vibrio alginolyticus]MCS0266270.1 DUF4225 domain-containing protein [Vibrio alginolyticus]MCS0270515.1 DUF4225 domain-containing protein [Vibrio alginolyticus]
MSNIPTHIEEDEVRVAVRGLLRQANMYSMSHLQDPTVQHQFREEYRFLGQCLLNDYRDGILVGSKIVRLVKQERQSLIDQAFELGKYSIGIVAGAGQLSAGYGLCVTSSVFSIVGASWCGGVGAPMMAHGANNVFENSYNIAGNIDQNWNGRYTGKYGNNTGFMKKGYRIAAKHMGLSEQDADTAFATVDLATSAYGLANKKKVVQTWTNAPDSKQLMLFNYAKRDYEKGIKAMSKGALGIEFSANYFTAQGALEPYFKEKE